MTNSVRTPGAVVRTTFMLFFLFLLVLLHLDTVLLLKLLEPQWVRHQCLVSSLFLLLDSEQRVLSNLGGGVSCGVRKLRGNEVLVRGTDL
jgi:hypothetical protein